MKKFYYIFGAVAVIGIGAVAWQVSSSVLSTAVAAPVELPELDNAALGELAQGVTSGDGASGVTIVEFGDYQCPGCGSFALSVKPQIDALLLETGRAEFVFYDFPLIAIHPNAFLAARAARCAGEQDKYWEYHMALFRNQSRWSSASMPASAFEQYAEDVGAESGPFEACLNSDKFADVVTANMELGARAGVSGTPTIFLRANGVTRRLNNYDFASLNAAIEELTAAGPGGQ
jgi:protein-disulfide isomerase